MLPRRIVSARHSAFSCAGVSHFRNIKVLIAVGADLTALSNEVEAPLHSPVALGALENVFELLDNSLDKRAKDNNGKTPWDLVPENIIKDGTKA
jgi:hypothetical protein